MQLPFDVHVAMNIFVLLFLVLLSESWNNHPSASSMVVDKARMTPGQWLGLVLCVSLEL